MSKWSHLSGGTSFSRDGVAPRPPRSPPYPFTKSSSPFSHQDFIKWGAADPHPPKSTSLHSITTTTTPCSPSALSCTTLLPNQMRKWLVWSLTDPGFGCKDKWPKVLKFNTLTKPTWSVGLMLQKNLWKKRRAGLLGAVMRTHRRLIHGHREGQTIFRISAYPALRGRNV